MSEIDLSIVIVSYNVRELLEQCLRSVINQQSTVNSESLITDRCSLVTDVIVVDNASSDHSSEVVREKFPSVRVIANKENRGFAAANNQGFAESRGRYVIMLNPDTVVREGALETLVRFMDAHPRAGACGGKLVFPDGSLQHSAFEFPTLAQLLIDFFPLNWRLTDSRLNGRYPRSWYAKGKPFPIDHPLGADFLVRWEAAEQVGWLDEKFFLNCEEIDWAMRLKRAGWEIWCVPSAAIVHYEAQSKRQSRDDSFVDLWRARFRLFEKHYSRAFQWAMRWVVRLGLWKLSRQARAEARRGLVTQGEAKKRLGAYWQVRHMTESGSPVAKVDGSSQNVNTKT